MIYEADVTVTHIVTARARVRFDSESGGDAARSLAATLVRADPAKFLASGIVLGDRYVVGDIGAPTKLDPQHEGPAT